MKFIISKLKTKVAALAIAIASVFNLNAQNDYLITEKGEKILIQTPDDVGITPAWVSFKDAKGEYVRYKHPQTKYLTFNGRQFLTLALKGGEKMRLQEIICYNDKYILTAFYSQDNAYNLLVFDWKLSNILPYKKAAANPKIQRELLNEYVKPYFADCNKAMIDEMSNNIEYGKDLIEGVRTQKCGTKDISQLVQAFLNGQTNEGKNP